MKQFTQQEAVGLAREELQRLHARCCHLEALLGGLAGRLSNFEDQSVQQMDEVTQIVDGLSNYFALLERSALGGEKIDQEAVFAEVKPYDLAERLCALTSIPKSDSGDVDLF